MPDSPHKIFIGGLPNYLNEDQVIHRIFMNVFVKYKIIKKNQSVIEPKETIMSHKLQEKLYSCKVNAELNIYYYFYWRNYISDNAYFQNLF